ncbi:MAG: multicopper oxidase domain-containing protein [Cenarchaeum sp. SB0665_bin_23]|nr:multicopper oxidase domain-containing protein [Cenarchaeum sp. SB0667_bin_13]MXY61792.1 multicopper oxidase domain-containing protein [Cenarchaeum sp. SB0665_bin_23]MXZ93131.1 multicopper oxidase domain-containing protein [Cenarchaeum sp. SB0666_bin_15]MYB46305.1 multicopper oxidase domain-containing protein [Cenarchaeum sp. SB0662_bin_33]MYC79420.1 multicopper oxidase domain-containing protein [Cenarchaeum sp. SB0661_bin_35]MYD58005.1 multicopper oxidase domain-containing protein [Cenarcha
MTYDDTPIMRTSPARTAKMMAIMLGICIAGGGIFFGLWDYWISEEPPIVAIMNEQQEQEVGTFTGSLLTIDLTFVESEDFRDFSFNEVLGEPGANPTINAQAGDKLVFNVVSEGMSFHSFGVTADESGTGGLFPGSEIGTPTNPLRNGQSGTSEFIPPSEGTYYYLCTVPGHREQGMVGEIIVSAAANQTSAVEPTGTVHDFTLDFYESEDFLTFAFSAVPGAEGANPEIRVNAGDEVNISATNQGISLHSFAIVRDPSNLSSVVWDSTIGSANAPLIRGESGQVNFVADTPGTYYYVCTVPGHAIQGMQGTFIVE